MQGSCKGVLKGGFRRKGLSLLDLYRQFQQAEVELSEAVREAEQGTDAK